MGEERKSLIEWILTPFIILSCFFQSVLEKNGKTKCRNSYLIQSSIQIIYCICLSFSSGIVLSIIGTLGIALRYDMGTIGRYTVFWIPLFTAILLIWVVILNYKNPNFSLSYSLYSIYWLSLNMKFKIRFWESLISIFIMPIILVIIMIMLLSNYRVPIQETYVILVIAFICCFFISILIYSESTKDELKRLARQFIVWLLIFIGFMWLTIYQVNQYVIQGKTQENIISISGTVLGLALTMTAIIDKTRNFYSKAHEMYKEEIKNSFKIGQERFSIDKVLKFKDENKKELYESYNIIIQWWKTGKKLKVIQVFLMLIITLIIFYIVNKNESIITDFFESFLYSLNKIWVGFFHGDEDISNNVLLLIIIGGFLIKFLLDLITNFKDSTLYIRIIYIYIVLGLLLMWVVILGIIFESIFEIIVKWIAIPIYVMLGVLTILEKIEKRKFHNKVEDKNTIDSKK
ncbi:hypothetical protein TPELB_15110 [Terrisporobacter petrolearius]|uniref:Uncharacterized protein n=1 Tax=Terrisporobacter petrolearius TaxID=1460447 RepID=A0ABZ3FF16_9FIRM